MSTNAGEICTNVEAKPKAQKNKSSILPLPTRHAKCRQEAHCKIIPKGMRMELGYLVATTFFHSQTTVNVQ